MELSRKQLKIWQLTSLRVSEQRGRDNKTVVIAYFILISRVMSHLFCDTLFSRNEPVSPIYTQAEVLPGGIKYQKVVLFGRLPRDCLPYIVLPPDYRKGKNRQFRKKMEIRAFQSMET